MFFWRSRWIHKIWFKICWIADIVPGLGLDTFLYWTRMHLFSFVWVVSSVIFLMIITRYESGCVNIWLIFFVLVVIQAKCLETGETVAIKKVLQDKRYKNRELQTMRLLDHPNVVSLKHCFFSTTEKNELYLNLVLEYVPETVHRVIKHYNKMNQRMPIIYVKLYTYQV